MNNQPNGIIVVIVFAALIAAASFVVMILWNIIANYFDLTPLNFIVSLAIVLLGGFVAAIIGGSNA